MTRHMPVSVSDRHSWLWLVVGAALLFFSSLGPSIALAAWLAPVFLLRFVRTQRARVGLPILAVVEALTLAVSWHIGTALAPPGASVPTTRVENARAITRGRLRLWSHRDDELAARLP